MVLSCPDEQNYAAIAKQLHETALEAEETIFTLEQKLRSALNRPTLIMTSTDTVTGIPDTAEWRMGPIVGAGSWVYTFDNTGLVPPELPDGIRMVSQVGEGVYEFGIYISFIPSGVVDDNSGRLMRILHFRPDPTAPAGRLLVDQAGYLLFEPSTGNEVNFTLIGTFRMQRDDYVEYMMVHSNTSSTLNSPAGAIAWAHKLSDATTLTVT